MRVLKRIKTEQGTFQVDAEFSEAEQDIIFEAGLNYLLQIGAVPFTVVDKTEASKFGPGGNG